MVDNPSSLETGVQMKMDSRHGLVAPVTVGARSIDDVGACDRLMYRCEFESMATLRVERVFMTPEWAKELLDHSTFRNRKVQVRLLKKLVRKIHSGQYRATHQGVALSPEQHVLDGQHRLMACAATGICIPMFVFYNLDKDLVRFMDRGCARTADQDLFMNDVKWSKERLALLRMNIELLGFDSTTIDGGEEYDRWEPLFRDGLEYVLPLIPRVEGTAKTAPVIGSIAFAYPTAPKRVRQFAERFVTGVQLNSNDPELKLQKHVHADKNKNRGQRPRALLGRATTWCIHKALKGGEVTNVHCTMEGIHHFRKYYFEQHAELLRSLPDVSKKIESYGDKKAKGKTRKTK